MRLVGLIAIVCLLGAAPAEAAKPRAPAKGKRVAAAAKLKPAGRIFTIAGEAFTESEIIDARAQPDLSGKAAIMITFDDSGRVKLARISGANKSKPLPFVLDGRVLMAPVLVDPIIDGVAQITGMFTITEAEALAKKISGKPPLPESL